MKVTMINSVGEYVAGEEYELEDSEADRFVLLRYAKADGLSRIYSDQELEAIEGTHQGVSLGG